MAPLGKVCIDWCARRTTAGRLRPESDVAARVRIRLAVESSCRRPGQIARTCDPYRPLCWHAVPWAWPLRPVLPRCRCFSSGPGAATGTMIAQQMQQVFPRLRRTQRRRRQCPNRGRRLWQPAHRRAIQRRLTTPGASGSMGAWSITWSRTGGCRFGGALSVPCRR